MAEPVFKLLRCDAEASHMLGWAKKEVRRLVDFARLDAFNRTWKFGDVSVRAQYFGGVARLWLEAEATERMAVWVTLPNPYPYRGVALGTVDRGAPTVGGTVVGVGDPDPNVTHNFTNYYSTVFKNSQGATVGSITGTVDYFSHNKVFGAPATDTRWVYVNYVPASYVGSGYGINGPDVSTRLPGIEWQQFNGEWVNTVGWVSSTWTPCSPTYEGTLAVDETAGTGGKCVVAVASDGEVLAKEFVTTSKYTLGTSVWNGEGSAQLFETVGPNTTRHHELLFAVPEDCIAPLTEAPPAYPGTDAPGTWTTDWAEAYAQGKEREATRLADSSERVISALKAGTFVLPATWDYEIKTSAPTSDNTYRLELLSASYTDTVESDTSAGLTQPGEKRTRREVSLSYTEQTDNGPQTRAITLNGTRGQVVEEHKDRFGARRMLSRVDTYDQWYEPAEAPSSGVENALSHAFLKDKTSHGMGLFWSGAWQATGGQHTDSKFGVPALDLVKAEYEPPAPAYFNTLEGVAPQFVLDYHRAYKPRYKVGEGDNTWLSSALMPGTMVKVIPLSFVKNGETRGMFGYGSQVEVHGSAVFTYDYSTGQLMFVAWTPLPGGVEKVRIQIPEEYELVDNALVIYGGIKWDDVKDRAKAQRKALADPNDPAHDPLMKAVLDALTPQE